MKTTIKIILLYVCTTCTLLGQQGLNSNQIPPLPVTQNKTSSSVQSSNVNGVSPNTQLGVLPVQPPSALPNANSSIDLQKLQTDIALLREKVDAANGTTNTIITVLGVVLALGTATSLISWWKHEYGTAPRAEARDNDLYALFVKGEVASQSRSEAVHLTFLEGSKTTLDLVNATLTLAKEASERAAKAVEARARIILQKLDVDAKRLLASVPAQDDRALVSDPGRIAVLRSLAQRIEGFQINRIVLPEEMRLSSECLFIRGMDFHLKQQYDDAFEAWEDVALRNETPDKLKGLSWYWIGYERNNLGNFDEACLAFQSALDTADGIRTYELNRILIESRFFKGDNEEQLLDLLKAQLISTESNVDEGIDIIRNKTKGTIGNIHLYLGNKYRLENNGDQAAKHYESAMSFFMQAKARDKWALFGYAEALYWLDTDKIEAQRILEKEVRPKAIDEEIKRIEPRTKVLAKTTELMCCIRVPHLKTEVPAVYGQVTEALGRVEEHLTVYSQVQRKNVPKNTFRQDLDKLMVEHAATGIHSLKQRVRGKKRGQIT